MRKVVIIIFTVHFLFVFIYNIGFTFKVDRILKYSGKYIEPVFEQNWSMFSNPATFTRYIAFRYKVEEKSDSLETSWYEANTNIYNYNKKYISSIAQRLIKYQSSCANSILDNINNCDTLRQYCLEHSSGFKSARAYATHLYRNTIEPQYKVMDIENVEFQFKIVDDYYPNFYNRKLDYYNENNHVYKELVSEYYQLIK